MKFNHMQGSIAAMATLMLADGSVNLPVLAGRLERHFVEINRIPVKTATRMPDLCEGRMRLPTSGASAARLRASLRKAGPL